MSVPESHAHDHVLRAATEARLPAGAWAVLTTLLFHDLNRDGIVWPSRSRLSEATGLGRAAITSALRQLQDAGLITDTGQTVYGPSRVTIWQIIQPPGPVDNPGQGADKVRVSRSEPALSQGAGKVLDSRSEPAPYASQGAGKVSARCGQGAGKVLAPPHKTRTEVEGEVEVEGGVGLSTYHEQISTGPTSPPHRNHPPGNPNDVSCRGCAANRTPPQPPTPTPPPARHVIANSTGPGNCPHQTPDGPDKCALCRHGERAHTQRPHLARQRITA